MALADTVKTFAPSGTAFDLSVAGSGWIACKTLAVFDKDSSALYFVPDSELSDVTTYNNVDDIRIRFTDAYLDAATPKAGLASNGDMIIRTNYPTLIRGPGRMVAELSIVSRE